MMDLTKGQHIEFNNQSQTTLRNKKNRKQILKEERAEKRKLQ